MQNSDHPASGRGLWLFVAGFSIAALLTLAAAVGTSMWQQQEGMQEFAADASVAKN